MVGVGFSLLSVPPELSNMSSIEEVDLDCGNGCGCGVSDVNMSNGDDFCCCCCCTGEAAIVGCGIGLLFVGVNTSNGDDFCDCGAADAGSVGPKRSSGLVLGIRTGTLAGDGTGAGTEPVLNASNGEAGFDPTGLPDMGRPREIGIRSGGCNNGAAGRFLVGAKAPPTPLALLADAPTPDIGAATAYGFTGAAFAVDDAKASKGFAIVLLAAPGADGANPADDDVADGPGKPPNALPPCDGANAADAPWEGANTLPAP